MKRFLVISFGLLFGVSLFWLFNSHIWVLRVIWATELAASAVGIVVSVLPYPTVLRFIRRQNVVHFHEWTVMIRNQTGWVENGPSDAFAPVGDLVQCSNCGQQRMLFGNRLFKIVRFVETNLIFERSDGLGAYVAAGTPVMHWSRNQLKKLPRGTVQIIDAD